MKKLLIASNNRGKLVEILALLGDLGLELITPADLGLTIDVLEDGQTYAENAAKKAQAFLEASGLPTLADDSGLEVDALGGRPGLHSNRFGPQPSTEASRRRYLLEMLQDKPRPWTARFRALIAIAVPGRPMQFTEGVCEGEIIPEERGQGGFGYDPLFYLPALGKTMAELSLEEKNRLSHRARALMQARPILQALFEDWGES
ncbi:MAG: RdgB/HAM1 family non-canonical purine NTP pyrophosphatase [Anaerolineales bacterium]|nr:RdgB/HAM1 family non-canonical purine NTP pyrophosphatase [Anaerolineales bacterium]MDW8227154.1 RdgB/HAM1 family non-canonical purine NTP pyrophosphatase [Anaerolineales bacterium]